MKPLRIPSASFCVLTLVAVLAVLTGTHAAAQSSTSPRQPHPAGNPATFYLLAFAGTLAHGKCLDFGPPPQVAGSPVFIYDCNGTVAQQVLVEEINDRHEVVLHAGTKVIGSRNRAVPGDATPTEFMLELQNRANSPVRRASANQVFALDGDSIILARSRPCASTEDHICPAPPPQLVVQVQNARGANGSPLVVAPRNLADSEFWAFQAIDGSDADPTTGFVPVATGIDLWNAVCASPKVRAGSLNLPVIDHPGHPEDDGWSIFSGKYAGPCSELKPGWGIVIVLSNPEPEPIDCQKVPGPAPGHTQDIGGCINLSGYPPIFLPAGVTLRGNRSGTNVGPQLYFSYNNQDYGPSSCGSCMLEVRGDYVRVTGLRLRGESRTTDESAPSAVAIGVDWPGPATGPLFSVVTTTQFIAIIDHNNGYDWGTAVVSVNGPYSADKYNKCTITYQSKQYTQTCATSLPDPSSGRILSIADDPATLANVRVARNFLHHNEKGGLGYGVNLGGGGRAFIEANTFLSNRHCIASDGEPHSEYRASYNLVLFNTPRYGNFFHYYHNQDFDMHGTNSGYGGVGGFYVDIVGNTFLGTDRQNYLLRAYPSHDTDFHGNISLENKFDAVGFKRCAHWYDSCGSEPFPIKVFDNQFKDSSANPTARLSVGDFDGDGDQDLFLAAGTAWYFSPGGSAEWRFLSAKSDTIDQLLFGDFDGDGRTDVVALRGGQFMVSWGGVSSWEVLNPDPTGGNVLLLPSAITAMAVGDFDGDGLADIFWADGKTWWVSYGGNTLFVEVQTSSHRVKDLRFGDFDRNGTTDVFSVVNDGVGLHWMVSYSPKLARGLFSSWTHLPMSLTNKVDGLVVADFNGDGLADVGMSCGTGCWKISYGGSLDWKTYNLGSLDLVNGGVGHFFSGRRTGADILMWNGNLISVAAGGAVAPQPLSSQDMR